MYHVNRFFGVAMDELKLERLKRVQTGTVTELTFIEQMVLQLTTAGIVITEVFKKRKRMQKKRGTIEDQQIFSPISYYIFKNDSFFGIVEVNKARVGGRVLNFNEFDNRFIEIKCNALLENFFEMDTEFFENLINEDTEKIQIRGVNGCIGNESNFEYMESGVSSCM